MFRKPRVTTEQSAGNSSYFSLGFITTYVNKAHITHIQVHYDTNLEI